jgi:hypothetical protein
MNPVVALFQWIARVIVRPFMHPNMAERSIPLA